MAIKIRDVIKKYENSSDRFSLSAELDFANGSDYPEGIRETDKSFDCPIEWAVLERLGSGYYKDYDSYPCYADREMPEYDPFGVNDSGIKFVKEVLLSKSAESFKSNDKCINVRFCLADILDSLDADALVESCRFESTDELDEYAKNTNIILSFKSDDDVNDIYSIVAMFKAFDEGKLTASEDIDKILSTSKKYNEVYESTVETDEPEEKDMEYRRETEGDDENSPFYRGTRYEDVFEEIYDESI